MGGTRIPHGSDSLANSTVQVVLLITQHFFHINLRIVQYIWEEIKEVIN